MEGCLLVGGVDGGSKPQCLVEGHESAQSPTTLPNIIQLPYDVHMIYMRHKGSKVVYSTRKMSLVCARHDVMIACHLYY